MNALIDKAHELGLSSDQLVEVRAKEIAKLVEQRDAMLDGFRENIQVRNFRIGGNNQAADLLQFDAATRAEVKQTREALEAAGFTAAEVLTEISALEQTLTNERLSIQQRYVQQSTALAEAAAAEQARIAEAAAADQSRIAEIRAGGFAALVSADQDAAIRRAQLSGSQGLAELLGFDYRAMQEVTRLRQILDEAGATAEFSAQRIAEAEALLADERLAIIRRYSGQATTAMTAAEQGAQINAGAGSALGVVTSLRDYVSSLATTNSGAGTAVDRFGAAQREFDAIFGAAQAGDARSISSLRDAAEVFRVNARELFGGGAGYAGGILSGQGVLVGALFGVAAVDGAQNAIIEAATQSVFDITKEPALAITAGARVFWDNTNRRITTTATGNFQVGIASLAALAADTTVRVWLNRVPAIGT